MKRLYRGDEISPLLHDVDAIEWLGMGQGWCDSPPVVPEIKHQDPTPTPTTNPLLPIENRLAELQALATDGDWRGLKAIAEGHGITRPNDGWDAAVLPILVAEYGQELVNELEVEDA